MPTWFLPPDFSFSADGPIQLGTVLAHPARPTLVLASASTYGPSIVLPKVKVITEKNHVHSNSHTGSNTIGIWAHFLQFLSASMNIETSRNAALSYSKVDHEIRSFDETISPKTAADISSLPEVHRQINSGIFGKRAVYIVSGLRIAKAPFTVTKETGGNLKAEASHSGPLTGGEFPVKIGGNILYQTGKTVTDSYDTAGGIVFAYRLHVIRSRRVGLESELFSHKSAFLTGEGASDSEEIPVVTEANKEELENDLEEESKFIESKVGDDEYCVSFNPEFQSDTSTQQVI